MAVHSSILAWRISATEEPGRLHTVHGVAKRQTWLKQLSTHIHAQIMYNVLHVLCLVTQSCPTLCDPMDCSLPGSSVHGIPQAIILEWITMPSSRESSQPRD